MKTSLSGRRTLPSTLALHGCRLHARSWRSVQIPVGARCSCPLQMCPTTAQLPGSCYSTSHCSSVDDTGGTDNPPTLETQGKPVELLPLIVSSSEGTTCSLGGQKYLKHFSLKKPSCQDHSHILSRLASSVSFNVMWGQQFYTELVLRFIKDRWRPNPKPPRTHLKFVPVSLDASVTLARLRRLWVWNRAQTMSKHSPL